MSFRRNKNKAKVNKAWQSFCITHSELIQRIGLAPALYETEQEFGIFLEHGHAYRGELIEFDVSELNPQHYQDLYSLIDKYFEAGYSWPAVRSFIALKRKDVKALTEKYPLQLS